MAADTFATHYIILFFISLSFCEGLYIRHKFRSLLGGFNSAARIYYFLVVHFKNFYFILAQCATFQGIVPICVDGVQLDLWNCAALWLRVIHTLRHVASSPSADCSLKARHTNNGHMFQRKSKRIPVFFSKVIQTEPLNIAWPATIGQSH